MLTQSVVKQVLKVNHWYTQNEVFQLLASRIPPEVAQRRYRGKTNRKHGKLSDDQEICTGRKSMLSDVINAMRRSGHIGTKGKRGAYSLRLLPTALPGSGSTAWFASLLSSNPELSIEQLTDCALAHVDHEMMLRQYGIRSGLTGKNADLIRVAARTLVLSKMQSLHNRGRLITTVVPEQRYYAIRAARGKSQITVVPAKPRVQVKTTTGNDS